MLRKLNNKIFPVSSCPSCLLIFSLQQGSPKEYGATYKSIVFASTVHKCKTWCNHTVIVKLFIFFLEKAKAAKLEKLRTK